jgi:hypothetical protein
LRCGRSHSGEEEQLQTTTMAGTKEQGKSWKEA